MTLLGVSPLVERLLDHLIKSALSTLLVLGMVALPIVVCCVILFLLARWQAQRVMETFGWKGILVTGWLGTPVHEISHAIACVCFLHSVQEVSLFKPNPSTGQLGYVKHSYNPKNPYAAILGNTFIPMAPFVGGALVILLLTHFLVPEFASPSKGFPSGPDFSSETLLNPSHYRPLLNKTWGYLNHLKSTVMRRELYERWQFYLYLYLVFCIAMHLAPSGEDFKNFWKPLLWFILLLFVANFIARFFVDFSRKVLDFLSPHVLTLTGILTFAIVVSLIGGVLILAITFVANRFKK